MTIHEEDGRKLRALVAVVPLPLPHYCDDPKTQHRVGLTLSREKKPTAFRMRTIWL